MNAVALTAADELTAAYTWLNAAEPVMAEDEAAPIRAALGAGWTEFKAAGASNDDLLPLERLMERLWYLQDPAAVQRARSLGYFSKAEAHRRGKDEVVVTGSSGEAPRQGRANRSRPLYTQTCGQCPYCAAELEAQRLGKGDGPRAVGCQGKDAARPPTAQEWAAREQAARTQGYK